MTPLDLIIDAPISAWFGAAGLTGQLAWPMLKTRNTVLTAQLGVSACYAAHFALMGEASGTTVCLIGATQTAIALIAGDRPWLSRLGLGFIPLAILLGGLTWTGLPTLLATCACCLIMIGRMQHDMLRMRAVILSASPFCIGHDVVVGAGPALCGSLVSCAIGAAALCREWRTRQGTSAAA